MMVRARLTDFVKAGMTTAGHPLYDTEWGASGGSPPASGGLPPAKKLKKGPEQEKKDDNASDSDSKSQ
jgi:hypothetical protein